MSRTPGTLLIAAVTMLIVSAAAVVTADSSSSDFVQIHSADGRAVLAPKVRIINWNDTVARFDSTTGAVYEYTADPKDTRIVGRWNLEVAPVSGPTSGMLQIQNPVGVENFGATFLVDVENGRTWILQRFRRNDNANWVEVTIQR